MQADSIPSIFRLEDDRLKKEIEEFLTRLFYHELKISPKDKCIILCERLGGIRKMTEVIGHVLFKKFAPAAPRAGRARAPRCVREAVLMTLSVTCDLINRINDD